MPKPSNLTTDDLKQRTLDCVGGPSSFTAELTQRLGRALAIDPLYRYSGSQIEQRFFESLDEVIAQVDRTPDSWVWKYHRSSAGLRANRIKVIQTFLEDYPIGRTTGRYLTAALPSLPFGDQHFSLALCSHLLFLYSDLLSFEFHRAFIWEFLRVSPELRIFPLLTLQSIRIPYVEPIVAELQQAGWQVTIECVQYELQRGGNQMMRIARRGMDPVTRLPKWSPLNN